MGKIIPGKNGPILRRIPYLHLIILLSVLQVFLALLFRRIHYPPRFSTPPWSHPLQLTAPLDPSSALITPIPDVLPDGLGHRFAVLNFEHLLARALSVRYIHRVAYYDSLTRDDRYAVEKLFGWVGIHDTRDKILKGCVVERRIINCGYRTDYPVCLSLKKGSPFKRLVNIPTDMIDCTFSRKRECWERLKEWAAGYGLKTLFQMQASRCHEKYRSGDFVHTSAWFRNMYWGYHRVVRAVDSLKTRVTLDEGKFQIGVHIRRGDFLNESSREVIPDVTYANLACSAKGAVDDVLNTDVPTDIHIFSEGIPRKGFLSRHDINLMQKMYVTEDGFAVDPKRHWRRLIAGNCKGDITVKTHIATDTVTAIHDMIAADVFIGSRSGLSIHIVEIMSRGVSITPVKKKLNKKGKRRKDGDWNLPYDYHKRNGSALVNTVELRRFLNKMNKIGGLRGIRFSR